MRAVLEEKRSSLNSPWMPGYAPGRTLLIDFRREGGYYIPPSSVPKWWNWQTRHLEGVVGKPVRVQIPPSAPWQYLKGFRLYAGVPFFFKTGRVARLWLAENLLSTYYSTAVSFTVDSGFIFSTGKGGFLTLPPARTRAQYPLGGTGTLSCRQTFPSHTLETP